MDAVLLFEKFFFNLFGKEKLASFEDVLEVNESKFCNLRLFILACVVEGIIVMIGTMFLSFYLGFDIEKGIITGFLFFFLPLVINYFWQDFFFERRKRKKEEMVVELLLEASVFYDNNSLIENIRKISETDIGLISRDFEKVYREINNGSSVVEALERMKKINKSRVIERIVDLFLHGYNSGANMSELLRECAEDLMENKAVNQERQAVMLVTKYTLILASGLIVPCILGVVIGLVNGLNFGAMGSLEIGLPMELRKELFSLAVLGTTIYVFEFAFLSSFFLAFQEGNKKNFWIYLIIILPTALICFFMAQTL